MGPVSGQKSQLNVSINGTLIGNATESFVFSKKYVHIMVQSALFNILCQRVTINEKEILSRKYEGVPYFVVAKVKKIKDFNIKFFASWIKGIKDAINRNYLKTIHLFLKNSNNDIIETYSLGLKYNTDPNYHNPSRRTPDHVKNATKALLGAIYGLSSQKFKEASKVQIEFTYTDDTPIHYEPPGFEAAKEPICLKISENPVLLGKISTGFHKLTARCSQRPSTPTNSVLIPEHDRTFSQVEDAEEDSPAPIDLTEPENETHMSTIDEEEFTEDIGIKTSKNLNGSNITVSENHDMSAEAESASENNSDVDVGANDVNCICKIKFESRVELISCSKCMKKYHAVCFGFEEYTQGIYFACTECGTTDAHLRTFDKKSQVMMARIRLMTYFVVKNNAIPDEILNSMSGEEATSMFKKMKDFGVIQKASRKDLKSCQFNQNAVRRLMAMLFNNSGDSQYLI